MDAAASSTALPRPAIPGTFSVPARRFLSCAPPCHKGADLHALSDIKESDAFRAVQLVSAGAEHINIAFVHIDRHMGKSLHRICMEQNTMLVGDTPDRSDRFDRSDLVICKHYGNKDRIRPNSSFHCFLGSTSPFSSTSRYVTSYPLFSRYSHVCRIA